MKKTDCYEISIRPEAAREGWDGCFLMKPTVYDLECAVVLEAEELQGMMEGSDQEDIELLAMKQEGLQRILEILGHLQDDFVEKHSWQGISVAGTKIGSINTNVFELYDAGEPA
jgi:hypothetical protein